MFISSIGLALIKKREALRLKAYLDTGGVPTIGYGHTHGVKLGDVCTQEQAERWLEGDASIAELAVNNLVRVSLNQNQFDALVCFVFNIGVAAFAASTLLRKLNASDYEGAANQFGRWIYDNGKVVSGLVNRRAAERDLFISELA